MTFKPIREYPKNEKGIPMIPKKVWSEYPNEYKGITNGDHRVLTMDDHGFTCIMSVVVI